MRGGVQLRTYCANCVLVHRCTHIRLYGDVHSKSQHLEVFQETVCDRQGPSIHVGEYTWHVLSTPCSFTNLKKKKNFSLGSLYRYLKVSFLISSPSSSYPACFLQRNKNTPHIRRPMWLGVGTCTESGPKAIKLTYVSD